MAFQVNVNDTRGLRLPGEPKSTSRGFFVSDARAGLDAAVARAEASPRKETRETPRAPGERRARAALGADIAAAAGMLDARGGVSARSRSAARHVGNDDSRFVFDVVPSHGTCGA